MLNARPAGRSGHTLRSNTQNLFWTIGTRFVISALAVLAVLTLTFFALNVTGNPAALLLPADASADEIDRVKALMGHDAPLLQQYLDFFSNALSGNVPNSIRYGESPLTIVFERLPASAILGILGVTLGVIIGLSVGWVAARRPDSTLTRIPLTILSGIDAIPTFFLGVVIIFTFSVRLGWLPASGAEKPSALVLPTLVLGLAIAAPIARVFRTSVLEVQSADHVRLAKAKGINSLQLGVRHILINALSPTLNVIGIHAGTMLGGAIVIETLFAYPGLGQLTISSVGARDYPVVLVSVVVLAIGFVAVSSALDLLALSLDKRVRR